MSKSFDSNQPIVSIYVVDTLKIFLKQLHAISMLFIKSITKNAHGTYISFLDILNIYTKIYCKTWL